MRARLDMDKIAKVLGGERRGAVTAKGGSFGALNRSPTSRRASRFLSSDEDVLGLVDEDR